MILAGLVGVVGGFVKLAFESLGWFFRAVFFHHQGDLVSLCERLLWWQTLLVPCLGGCIAGGLLMFVRKKRGASVTDNLLEAVVAGDGRLPLKNAFFKGCSSLFSINTGASVGQEGAISYLSSALASNFGQLFRWPPYRLRLLLACGASAGIAAAYNAPIAGAVFAAEIVLGNYSMNLFAPLVFSSVMATMVSRTFFGMEPWYVIPAFEFTHISQLPLFIFLGLLAGAAGAFFLKTLKLSEVVFNQAKLSKPVALALGGLLIGALALVFPQVWGNGYTGANLMLSGTLDPKALLALLVFKWIAILIAVGSGAVGGVFTPTLFIGCGIGSLFGLGFQLLDLQAIPPMGVFALAGMGALLAATTHSPLLAMIMIFEISLNYSLMPPLMIACAVATLVSKSLHRDNVYTAPLKTGAEVEMYDTQVVGKATQKTVGDLMQDPVLPVRETATLRQIGERFLRGTFNHIPVVDTDNQLLGMVLLQDLKEHLNDSNELQLVIALDVMRPPDCMLTPGQNLMHILPLLMRTELRNLPVVNSFREKKLLGSLSRMEALDALAETVALRSLSKR